MDMTQFNSVVAQVPQLARASELSIGVLSGGLTNSSYLVATNDARFVVRIGCDNASDLGIDRVAEEAAITMAHAAGITPEVVLFTQPEGHLVTRYLSRASIVSAVELGAPGMISRVASLLRGVHTLGPVDRSFNPYADIRRWMRVVESRGSAVPTRLGHLLGVVARSEHDRPHVPESDLVLCHNDPYHLNFLDDGDLWLIDWEYAGMGDAMYDLAGIAYRLDSDGRDHLLTSYFGAADSGMRKHLEALIPVYVCWNVVWSLMESFGGRDGFDYLDLAEDFLDSLPYRQ
jgi:thiamine kinase-like enzyme